MSKDEVRSPKSGARKKREKKDSKEVLELKQALGEAIEDLQRVQADYMNFKKRTDEDLDRRQALGQKQMAAVLLPTIDNIERALSHIPEDLKGNAWAQGVKNTADQLFESLEKLGIVRIKTDGEPFDPELMEAVQVDDGDGDKEVVSEELQSGYTMKDELIRPAMVKVRRSK